MPYGDPYGGGYMAPPQPPGFFGTTAQGMFGAGNQPGGQVYQQQMAQSQGGMMAGAGVVNAATNTLPGMAMAGYMGATMVAAPLMEYGASAGVFGKTVGAAGKGLGMLDPFNAAMTLGMKGGRAGMGLGRLAAGGMARMGMMSAGGLGASAMAGAGGLAGAALPAGAVLGAAAGMYYGGKATLGQVYGGATDVMQGQTLSAQLGPAAGMGQMPTAGQGQQMAGMMRGMGKDMGMDPKELGRIAKELNAERVFQTVSGMKEFQSKFKEVMGAVKEISQMTQTTIDEAAKTFTDLRRQGFYTTADIKAAAVRRDAREASTGLSSSQMSAVGSAGAQMGRAFGLRGRVGSEAAQAGVSALAGGLRRGTVSEELVGEMGGVESAAMRLTQRQMGFLSSPRGRAMIAMSMKEGGTGVDPMRMAAMMQQGVTTESIVEGAAGRGLGVLGKAGMREAKEAAMPYASLMMVQMAQSQSRQLGWGSGKKSTLGMLGTMGIGRDEGELMLQQIGSQGEQLKAEAAESTRQRSMALLEERKKGTTMGQLKSRFGREFTDPLRGLGGDVYTGTSEAYTAITQSLTGTQEYRTGDRRARQQLLGTLGKADPRGEIDLGATGAQGSHIFGGLSSRDVTRENVAMFADGGEVDLGKGGFMGTGTEGSSMVIGPGDIGRAYRGIRDKGITGAPKGVSISKAKLEELTEIQRDVVKTTKAFEGKEKAKLERLAGREGSFLASMTGGLLGQQSSRGAVDDEVAEIMQSGEFTGERQDVATYVLEKKMGNTTASSYEEYKQEVGKSSSSQRKHMERRQALAVSTKGTSLEGVVKGFDPNAFAGMSLKESRDVLQKESTELFRARVGERDPTGWRDTIGKGVLGAIGGKGALAAYDFMSKGEVTGAAMLGRKMAEDDAVRGGVRDLVTAIESGDDEKVTKLMGELKESTGGGAAFKTIQQLERMKEEDPDGWKAFKDDYEKAGGVEHLDMSVRRKEMEREVATQGEKIQDRLKRDALTKGMSPQQISAFESFSKAGLDDRGAAHMDLLASFKGGGITEKELQQIGQVGGGRLHTTALKVQQLASGKGGGFDEMLSQTQDALGRGLSDEEMKGLTTGTKESRTEMALKLMGEGKQLESLAEGETGGASQVSVGDAFVQFAEVMPQFAMVVERMVKNNPDLFKDLNDSDDVVPPE